MRQFVSYPHESGFLDRLLAHSRQYDRVCFLDSSRHPESAKKPGIHSLIALGSLEEITITGKDGFDSLRDFSDRHHDWLFGYLSYDLKNEVEELQSTNPDGVDMPLLHFFRPEWLVLVDQKEIQIGFSEERNAKSANNFFQAILDTTPDSPIAAPDGLELQSRFDKATYLDRVRRLKQHIRRGDIYEANFCQEFFVDPTEIDPYGMYDRLNRISPTPFSCFYRLDDHYLMCGSPERFLRKKGNRFTSQPIKGTAPRGVNAAEDQRIREALRTSEKDRSENVMIVDLVRNDLSRSAKRGSVQVEELFGIYSFPKVHQMISTVTSELREDIHFVDALRMAFPMGSMTGAPKIRAMELIEDYEASRRGLYSGAVGYITPEKDFDFNVVIRSLLYNQASQYLSFQVGGAIIDASDPEAEYEECLVKARPLLETLGVQIDVPV